MTILTQLTNAIASLDTKDQNDVIITSCGSYALKASDADKQKTLDAIASVFGLTAPKKQSYTPKQGGYWAKSVKKIDDSQNNGYCIKEGDFINKMKDYKGSDPVIVVTRGKDKLIAIGTPEAGENWTFTYPDSGNDGIVKDFKVNTVYNSWSDAKSQLIGMGVATV
jgi:hypothetical protein